MRLAIMQPYLFPYLGYFQLLAAVDRFVVYDDVAYIKGGWINRNRWLVNGQPAYFTFPVRDASSFRLIAHTQVAPGPWPRKLLKTFQQVYARAPFFAPAFALLEQVVSASEPSIGHRAVASLRAVADYLGVATRITDTSAIYGNADLRAAERVIDICQREGATVYINALGGTDLYDREAFAAVGVDLRFLRPRPVTYPQFGGSFVPHLSILDVIAFNPVEAIRDMLAEYELL
jgi:hypothetical protein